ncbi:hypothetical protein PLESTB_001574000 [Pleodorina starrii]|uniref:DUF2415 domain-containing protein n=1 Tax=Pleodorina starrii TaxID=330485 RepID=A0A9W6BYG8_9CHLO|nr:hypothetical protein PLESTM_000879400 [Pleodorina starrii]GLC60100.1 hypothetical protein PLESTB_001574000 [Pleodorina starrii]GLC68999.1 hypothetical protein PLESTF_000768000 [Pleodorina starrii]
MGSLTESTFTTSHERHDICTTIHHWQLRDLVAAGDTSDELLYVCDSSVLHYNEATREVTAVLSLDWCPNSMTYAYGMLAAGGPASQLCVKDLREKRLLHRDPLGGSVNNAVHVAKLAGQLVLYACNNEYVVKVFNIGPHSLVPTTSFRTPVPINYCALSPDGRFLSCVGDCGDTMVYAVRESSYTRVHSFQEAIDTGSSTAWSPSGTFLASAHQDGTLAVWDIRAAAAVHKYRLTTACRNVKFSPGGVMDLMAFAEHEDMAHIVDVRQWSAVQNLNAGCGQGNDISGMSFAAGGDRLWVGLDNCVMSYDLDTVGRRAFGYGSLC